MEDRVKKNPRRVKVLYGCEVWILDGLGERVIEFEEGQFSHAKHAHVFCCGNERMAEVVLGAVKPVSDKYLIEDATS